MKKAIFPPAFVVTNNHAVGRCFPNNSDSDRKHSPRLLDYFVLFVSVEFSSCSVLFDIFQTLFTRVYTVAESQFLHRCRRNGFVVGHWKPVGYSKASVPFLPPGRREPFASINFAIHVRRGACRAREKRMGGEGRKHGARTRI